MRKLAKLGRENRIQLGVQVGILLGTRMIAAGRNTAATITPAVAINVVR